jgi:deazaflavin-dependent oxidoreductase (nitroreductase family)
VLGRLTGVHTSVYRLTGGLIGHRVPGFPPILLLDHTGARSGTRRTTPLAYVDDGRDVVLVASKGGFPKHPGWYHNLRAHPNTTVQVGPDRRPVRARVATAAERERLWPMAVAAYDGYREYQERTEREIPLVILEPRQPSPSGPAASLASRHPPARRELEARRETGPYGW